MVADNNGRKGSQCGSGTGNRIMIYVVGVVSKPLSDVKCERARCIDSPELGIMVILSTPRGRGRRRRRPSCFLAVLQIVTATDGRRRWRRRRLGGQSDGRSMASRASH